MTPQERYQAEKAKYAHIQIEPGKSYKNRTGGNATYTIVSINIKEMVSMYNQSGHLIIKTLYWCRKHLREDIRTTT